MDSRGLYPQRKRVILPADMLKKATNPKGGELCANYPGFALAVKAALTAEGPLGREILLGDRSADNIYPAPPAFGLQPQPLFVVAEPGPPPAEDAPADVKADYAAKRDEASKQLNLLNQVLATNKSVKEMITARRGYLGELAKMVDLLSEYIEPPLLREMKEDTSTGIEEAVNNHDPWAFLERVKAYADSACQGSPNIALFAAIVKLASLPGSQLISDTLEKHKAKFNAVFQTLSSQAGKILPGLQEYLLGDVLHDAGGGDD